MNADPRQVEVHARRLVERLGGHEQFRVDPDELVAAMFGIRVRYRDEISSVCGIDGSYDHLRRVITVDVAATRPRQLFTILHELAHALGRDDAALADWLWGLPDGGRVDEERVANAFAGLVLLPDELVTEHIPAEGPCAHDVQQLAEASSASREAACVRASHSLRGPGLVVLSHGRSIQLAVTRGIGFGLRRETDLGPESFFARASQVPALRRSGVRVRFPATQVESETLEADAVTDAQGYTFSVLMEHSAPWVALTPLTSGPIGHEIDCEHCDRTRITYRAECARCGDRPCPDHGCSCAQHRTPEARRCRDCNIELPTAAPPTATLCDMCG